MQPAGTELTLQEKVLQLDFILIVGLIVGVLSVYLVRLIIWAIKMVLNP
jgi:hypothetical protein